MRRRFLVSVSILLFLCTGITVAHLEEKPNIISAQNYVDEFNAYWAFEKKVAFSIPFPDEELAMYPVVMGIMGDGFQFLLSENRDPDIPEYNYEFTYFLRISNIQQSEFEEYGAYADVTLLSTLRILRPNLTTDQLEELYSCFAATLYASLSQHPRSNIATDKLHGVFMSVSYDEADNLIGVFLLI